MANLPPMGGVVDCRGLTGTQTFSTNIMVGALDARGASGPTLHLIFDPATRFVFRGIGAAVTVREGCDHCSIEGLNLNLKNSVGSTYGVYTQGAWYGKLKNIQVRGAPIAGVRISNDGVTNRGVYFLHLTDVLAGDPVNELGPIDPVDRNGVGIQIESVNKSGITFTLLERVWATYALSDGLQITAKSGVGTVQAIGTLMISGGAGYNGDDGVDLTAGTGGRYGANLEFHGADFEGNAGWGIESDANVISVVGLGEFGENSAGDWDTLAQRVDITVNGQRTVASAGGSNAPAKNEVFTGPAKYASRVLQRTPGIEWKLPSMTGIYEGAIKGTNDSAYKAWCSSSIANCMWYDVAHGRLGWGGTNFPNQFWVPGSTGSVTFPSATTTLAGLGVNQTFTADQTFTGTIAVGAAGTGISQMKIYASSLTPAAVAAATCAEQTFRVSGLTTADKVIVNGPPPAGGTGMSGARVSAKNTLAINWCNPTGGSLTPASGTYNVVAVRN